MISNTVKTRPTVLFIGASGLIGSRLTQLLTDRFEIESLGISQGVDITKSETLAPLKNSKASVVVHLAAKADVDGCEKDKQLGKIGPAWQINVDGVKNVSAICRKEGKKIIYFSTDFVFNGEKLPPYRYDEEDQTDPVNWYAKTKYEGEKVVQGAGIPHIILRTAYPYRLRFPEKQDFVRIILSRLQSRQKVKAVTDHIMNPTFIDDIAKALDALISQESIGIYHVVGDDALSPFDATVAIAKEFNLDESLIQKTTRAEFFKNRAKRPFNLGLKNDKIRRLGVMMTSFHQGLRLMHQGESTL